MLKDEEQQKPFQVRKTEGDASESGLIKFIQPIKDLSDIRNLYPIHSYKIKDENGEEVSVNWEIPFNSFKKYNLIVRDLSADKSDNSFMLIMKGAPERIWNRWSKILIDGEEREITDYWNKKYEEANAALGKNGERVLAFANIYLKVKEYKRDYHFIMKEEDKNYQMEGLTFIGLVSLNDPPRKYVDQSVAKCRRAGIKVIMVTGDQPVTAAAIAKKINIITPGSKVNVDMVEQGMDAETAMEKCDAIVIHGDELAKRYAAQEHLEDIDPEKGRFLQKWIAKEEVVFARTTPAQKLLIVDACQKSGHIVTVTGDGVNDSPAIKKADIGIAMGSGSDVAKNAADMIILDDDFSSIVNGVEEGRLIFDNLKKAITYLLASNIPELVPFMVYIVLQIPLPMTTIFALIIGVGTDMVPAVSYSYENAELDIMLRMPRNSKRDHIANAKVISHGYFQIGIIQAWWGFVTYFVAMNDYGFKPATLIGIIFETGHLPLASDVYTPTATNKGNHGAGTDGTINWNVDTNNNIDMRLFYYKKSADSWSNWRWSNDAPNFWRKNVIDNIDIWYKIEALRYAQTSFLMSVVCWQWAQLLIVKTRSLSIIHQGFKNITSFYGWLFETLL